MRAVAALAALALWTGSAMAQQASDAPTSKKGKTDDLRQQVEQLKQRVDELSRQEEPAKPAASATHLGGYGELHYTHLDSGNTIDLHRVVLFVGHDFTEHARFVSEIEFEHALIENDSGAAEGGAVEVEQAYVEFDVGERSRARAGLLLVPVGILNETHEPPAFYGVERNPVESEIIPTTWRETGAAVGTAFGDSGVSLDVAVHSGLSTDGTDFEPHEGLQEGAEATANKFAGTGRLKFTGPHGLQIAATAQYQQDVTQGVPGVERTPALLLEGHAMADAGPVNLRALYAAWHFDSDAARALFQDRQQGYYGEASWRVVQSFGFFGRYSVLDNGGATAGTEVRQVNAGFNYWPIDNVVLKADWQDRDGNAGRDDDGFALGVGWQF
ncbi:MAG TPA: porin [Candidatus Binatia bacterium]|nr:porin [Candidatus Binatia bacterium]